MSNERTVEMNEVVYAAYKAGEVTLEQAEAMMLAVKKLEYRKTYNARPEVKAKRAAYMKQRNEKARAGQQLLAQLLRK